LTKPLNFDIVVLTGRTPLINVKLDGTGKDKQELK